MNDGRFVIMDLSHTDPDGWLRFWREGEHGTTANISHKAGLEYAARYPYPYIVATPRMNDGASTFAIPVDEVLTQSSRMDGIQRVPNHHLIREYLKTKALPRAAERAA